MVVDAAKSVTAEFTLNAHTLTVSKTGTGTGNGDQRSGRDRLRPDLFA